MCVFVSVRACVRVCVSACVRGCGHLRLSFGRECTVRRYNVSNTFIPIGDGLGQGGVEDLGQRGEQPHESSSVRETGE